MFGPRTRGSRTPAAVRRSPPVRRVPDSWSPLVGVLAALGVGSFFLRGTSRDGVELVQDKAKGEKRVVPDKVTASSAQDGHGANLVNDGTPNKYWAPGEAGDGRGEYVEA